MGWRCTRRWLRLFILALVYFYCVILLHSRRQSINDSTLFESRVPETEDIPIEPLFNRGAVIPSLCRDHPPPLSTFLKKRDEVLPVSAPLAKHFLGLFQKEASKRLIHLPEFDITWCIVPKVASTSFARSLLHLEGFDDTKIGYRDEPLQVILRSIIRPISNENLHKTVMNSTSFLFTRHPFHRIVSAFRNKLENADAEEDGQYFYNNYGRRIVERYRESRITKTEKLDINDKSEDYEYRKEPTFLEFVDYLINTDVNLYDEHWRPVWLQCNVCHLQFDVIVKYEHFKEEIHALISHLQKSNKLPANFVINFENSRNTNEDVTVQYMKTISKDKIKKVYDKYKEDFIYFNYDMEDF